MVLNTETSMNLAKGLSAAIEWTFFSFLESLRGAISQAVKIERRILVAGGWDDDLFIFLLPRATISLP